MNCLNHPDAQAVAYCRECGKALCETCRRQSDGTIYCEEHAPAPAWNAAPSPPPPPYAAPEPPRYQSPEPTPYTSQAPRPVDPGASPGLAFLLGFIPGVGAIYNGQYVKGLVHVVILGVLIAFVSSDEVGVNMQPLFGMMIAAWVFYMAFEAYHTAKKRQMGLPVDEFSSIVPRRGQPSRFPVAPAFLIAVGLLFLLHNLNIIRLGELIHYWPVALICLGVYMLYERLSSNPQNPDRGAPPNAAPEVFHERR
jgi:TM2 domain-containing membrane protein YozV